ncbi:MAG: DUF2225 domain-containing protein [Firmicutes bacterium]|nr:DUF2225 domain-containing protein [Bacillota bacterium]
MQTNEIFSGLDKFGLSEIINKIEINTIFYDLGKLKTPEVQPAEPAPVANFAAKDYLYIKKMTCPICKKEAIATGVRETRVRMEQVEIDLHVKSKPLDPIFYDIVICDSCGYTTTKPLFSEPVKEIQMKLVLQNITPVFKKVEYPQLLTIDMAIERYKLALLNTIIRQTSSGEKAYFCMKLAWLLRVKGDIANRNNFAKLAISAFNMALANESLPIMALSGDTIFYVMAAFYSFLEDYDESLKLLSTVVVSKTASDKLKDHARDLKADISTIKKSH